MTNFSWIIFIVVLGVILILISTYFKNNNLYKTYEEDVECAVGLLDDEEIPESEVLFQDLILAMKEIAPEINVSLNPGASEEDIQKLQDATGVYIPHLFTMIYSVHNGQKPASTPFYFTEEWLSIDHIIEVWEMMHQLWLDKKFQHPDGTPWAVQADPEIRNDWWNPNWLPITHDGAGNYLCMDLDHTDLRSYGQIILFERDNGSRTLIAASLTHLFQMYLDDLRSGELFYSDDYGGIVEKWE